MKGRFSRFLHLERARGERQRPEERPRLQGEARFSSVVRPHEGTRASEPTVPGAHTERFRAPPAAPLALEDAREGRQPFVRCAHCERDHSVYATACGSCGSRVACRPQGAGAGRLDEGHPTLGLEQ